MSSPIPAHNSSQIQLLTQWEMKTNGDQVTAKADVLSLQGRTVSVTFTGNQEEVKEKIKQLPILMELADALKIGDADGTAHFEATQDVDNPNKGTIKTTDSNGKVTTRTFEKTSTVPTLTQYSVDPHWKPIANFVNSLFGNHVPSQTPSNPTATSAPTQHAPATATLHAAGQKPPVAGHVPTQSKVTAQSPPIGKPDTKEQGSYVSRNIDDIGKKLDKLKFAKDAAGIKQWLNSLPASERRENLQTMRNIIDINKKLVEENVEEYGLYTNQQALRKEMIKVVKEFEAEQPPSEASTVGTFDDSEAASVPKEGDKVATPANAQPASNAQAESKRSAEQRLAERSEEELEPTAGGRQEVANSEGDSVGLFRSKPIVNSDGGTDLFAKPKAPETPANVQPEAADEVEERIAAIERELQRRKQEGVEAQLGQPKVEAQAAPVNAQPDETQQAMQEQHADRSKSPKHEDEV